MKYRVLPEKKKGNHRIGAVVIANETFGVDENDCVEIPDELTEAADAHWALEREGGHVAEPVDDAVRDHD